MKKVSIIGTRGYPSYYGGFETAVRRLAPYLADAEWDVTVYGRDGSVERDPGHADHRIRSVLTLGLNTRALSTMSYGLTSVLNAMIKRPDVALVMNVANGFWLPLLRLRGIKTVVNVDGIEWERDKWGKAAKLVFKAGAFFTAKFADLLICDAVEIQRIWRERYGVSSKFIPYGGDVPPSLPVEEGLRSRGYVLMVARFVPENTVLEFFEAAKELAKAWDVVIVGSSGFGGELDEAARALSEASEKVHWLGHISDDRRLFALWQHAGAYFHGHSVGGTNPALVQAMACGAPVVARDTTYNREVLSDTATYAQPTEGSIVDSVSELMGSPELQSTLSAGAVERARSFYSWELVCGAYNDALMSITQNAILSKSDTRQMSR
ncbi:DUF1972 domain-containing protein [Pseudarthrobacter niigatensis]|uniref:Glycosyltransferase involved in cell wall biosynthesis n=1 Tax=Pseudarthrobacter niigatensis TaxID=369935 RepID=A0AAJ1SSJ8_9MICC|nr:DUF1972 domain-containing protein [Pseudarthrobacter niigatensis]MDQ0145996.1 glycosyltransferase involved in cell wall biosynthesis [Pseudarthrobacter niigatensis]MDQ0266276.1 glycosyltransferase involved in cell wall biosynthesis [Pseudarthrobacter niigatensis]